MIQAFRSQNNKDFIVVLDDEIWEMTSVGTQRYMGRLIDKRPAVIAYKVVPSLDNLPLPVQRMISERADEKAPAVEHPITYKEYDLEND